MTRNMSTTDRLIRLTITALVAVLYFTNVISGTVAIVLGAIAIIFLLTSFVNFCPLYKVLGISTFRNKKTS